MNRSHSARTMHDALEALRENDGNLLLTSEQTGISRDTLSRWEMMEGSFELIPTKKVTSRARAETGSPLDNIGKTGFNCPQCSLEEDIRVVKDAHFDWVCPDCGNVYDNSGTARGRGDMMINEVRT